jgi:propionate CoA-transferase
MRYRPIVSGAPRLMDARIFDGAPMGLKDDLLTMPIAERLTYEPSTNTFFVNFEALSIRTPADISAIESCLVSILEPLGKKVNAIVNYDSFSVTPEMEDEYIEMVRRVVSTYYINVTRYSTSSFLRMKLGDRLKARGLAPHVYETREAAQRALKDGE